MEVNHTGVLPGIGVAVSEAEGSSPFRAAGGHLDHVPPLLMPTAPLFHPDFLSQQLLAQMQMLSFYQRRLQFEKQYLLAAQDTEQQQMPWGLLQTCLAPKEEPQLVTQPGHVFRQKSREQESAIASDEVKQHLRHALLNRHKRNDSAANATTEITSAKESHDLHSEAPDSCTSENCNILPYPIRKTASEPNLKVKAMLKQKLRQERKESPLSKAPRAKEVAAVETFVTDTTHDASCCPYDSSTSSSSDKHCTIPVMHTTSMTQPAAGRVQERFLEQTQFMATDNLHISMPNISNGLAHSAGPISEEERYVTNRPIHDMNPLHRSARSALSTSGSSDGCSFSGSLTALNGVRRSFHPYLNKSASIESQAQNGQNPLKHLRPLSRTRSAPLPVISSAVNSQQRTILEHQKLIRQHQEQVRRKKLVLGQLRQTILHRSRTHMEQVDEETEQKMSFDANGASNDRKELSPSAASHLQQGARSARCSSDQFDHPMLAPVASRVKQCQMERVVSNRITNFGLADLKADYCHGKGPLISTAESSSASRTGVAYDEAMLKHHCLCGNDEQHIESPSRILSIWNRLKSSGLLGRCLTISSKKASLEQLQLCHSEAYTLFFGINSYRRQKLGLDTAGFEFDKLPCGGLGVDADTIWNEEHSAQASRVATGCVIELASRVYSNQLKNGIAIVRPPGHHAEASQAMGFCYFNSIAIAAKHLKHKLGATRVLIVDWDVHHGNGTQQMTYDDPTIMYISVHRHDGGNFFPGTGYVIDCGEREGLGFNVNIPFNGGPMGDAEYMAAFRSIVIPIVKDFQPQITLVSAGFDAAEGHGSNLGGYSLTSACFGYMTQQLMSQCEGRVVLVLEGGYNLTAICDASEMCVKALLGDTLPLPCAEEITRRPCPAALQTLRECVHIQSQFWPGVKGSIHRLDTSFVDSLQPEKEGSKLYLSSMSEASLFNERTISESAGRSSDTELMEEA